MVSCSTNLQRQGPSGVDSQRISHIVDLFKLKPFRAQQLRKAFFDEHLSDFAELTTFSKALRAELQSTMPAMTIQATEVRVASDGRAHKALLKLSDGRLIETVLLNPKPGLWSCCISSQVGCALKCSFCATGQMGFSRHLTREEITDQVLFWRQYIRQQQLDASLRNVVYMGMGEPLHNHKNVFASIEELTNPETFNIGDRHISVSTSGLIPQIATFSERFPQVNLALSLHAANDELRLRLMPINKAYPLADLATAITEYLHKTNRKIFIEYILLDGENDGDQHAEELAVFLKGLGFPQLVHVNLIVYNPTDANHREASRQRARAFKSALQERGVNATIRRNLGRDIDGACGQLVVKSQT